VNVGGRRRGTSGDVGGGRQGTSGNIGERRGTSGNVGGKVIFFSSVFFKMNPYHPELKFRGQVQIAYFLPIGGFTDKVNMLIC
jgi:hypothetical protein